MKKKYNFSIGQENNGFVEIEKMFKKPSKSCIEKREQNNQRTITQSHDEKVASSMAIFMLDEKWIK